MNDVATVDFTREKVDLIKQTVAKGATDLELELFLHACKRTGLDPLMKQVHAIKRWNSKEQRETMTIQTGIDGYRLIADRTGNYAGSVDPVYEVASDGFPDVAVVTVTKFVSGIPCAFSASARWKEYVQVDKQGQPTSMWKKMPFLMLGKCAEALALRKAFPAELSGVYTHEEMMQADVEVQPAKPAILANKQTAQAEINELRNEGVAPVTQRPTKEDGGEGIGNQPPTTQQGPDAPPSSFFWRYGKKYGKNLARAGTPIEAIDLEYLVWAAQNATWADHATAAVNEIDRRQKQDVLNYEQEQA